MLAYTVTGLHRTMMLKLVPGSQDAEYTSLRLLAILAEIEPE